MIEVFLFCCLSLLYISLGLYPTVATGLAVFPSLLIFQNALLTHIPIVFVFSVCIKKIVFNTDENLHIDKLAVLKFAVIYASLFFKTHGLCLAVLCFIYSYIHDSLETVLYIILLYFYLDYVNPFTDVHDFMIYTTFVVFIIGMLMHFGRKMIIEKFTVHQEPIHGNNNNNKKTN